MTGIAGMTGRQDVIAGVTGNLLEIERRIIYEIDPECLMNGRQLVLQRCLSRQELRYQQHERYEDVSFHGKSVCIYDAGSWR